VDRIGGTLQQLVEVDLARDEASDARDHCEPRRTALLCMQLTEATVAP